MYPILALFFIAIVIGLFLLFSSLGRLPSIKVSKSIMNVYKRDKKSQRFSAFLMELSIQASGFVKLDDYKKRRLQATLKSANISLSPEVYVAKAWVKALAVLLLLIPTLLILPLLSLAVILLSVGLYYKEIKSADKIMAASREEIEWELTRFVSSITQELKSSRNVLRILETYMKNAGSGMKHELEITIADMRSGSYEAALTRFESRIGSPSLSEVIRGLIGVLRGDNGVVYFQMLLHDLKQHEYQKLKSIAQKRPEKIRRYSFLMLLCFICMYILVMGMEIMRTLDQMF